MSDTYRGRLRGRYLGGGAKGMKTLEGGGVGGGGPGFFSWLRHPQRGLPYLLCSLLIILIFLALFIHYYLSNYGGLVDDYDDSPRSGANLLPTGWRKSERNAPVGGGNGGSADEFGSMRLTDARFQIQELGNIRLSVTNELLELERRRQNLLNEISSYGGAIEGLKQTYQATSRDLDRLKVTFHNLELEHSELAHDSVPHIEAPLSILPSQEGISSHTSQKTSLSASAGPRRQCSLHTCFDFSRCSVTAPFLVHLYDPDKFVLAPQAKSAEHSGSIDEFVKKAVLQAFGLNVHSTRDPSRACIYVVLIGAWRGNMTYYEELSNYLHGLPYWHSDGTNHILLTLARDAIIDNVDLLDGVDIGRAIIAQTAFTGSDRSRTGFDIVLPPVLGPADGDIWEELTMIVPAYRRYLLSFVGEVSLSHSNLDNNRSAMSDDDTDDVHHGSDLHPDDLRGDKKINNRNEEPDDDALYENNKLKHEDVAVENALLQRRRLHSLRTSSDSLLVHGSKASILNDRTVIISESTIVESLKSMQRLSKAGAIFFQFACDGEDKTISGANERKRRLLRRPYGSDWILCGTAEQRIELLRHSTFALIIAAAPSMSDSERLSSTTFFHQRLYEALKSGAVPVLLGVNVVDLPFSDIINWHTITISLPIARVTELHFIVRSLEAPDILEMRRQGRAIFETYFGTVLRNIDTLIAGVRRRLGIPAPPIKDETSPSVFVDFQPMREPVSDTVLALEGGADEMLGPVDLVPIDSVRFRRNFTEAFVNSQRGPVGSDVFWMYPYTPFEPVMSADAKFIGSSSGFRPIGDGAGGAGKEFVEALGGNHPREQFTGLPYLNKVVVVWNSLTPPATDLRWPDIGVEVHVIRTKTNSLNNRFLPYDAIQTEAILSIDDDAHLRHDEITFGFRVWRESRDRIVGFPGRFHAWDLKAQNWLYNSNYSCELSLVLTGAAFFHKYYAYLYSYVMPQAIRDKVDEYVNCEDLAMNFLIAHITRKPPIKVTSRWTFRCPGCPKALSVEESHFYERHKCINFFVQIYGYMPLLNTQFRADSVLFKTRIPHDKQKCFKFI